MTFSLPAIDVPPAPETIDWILLPEELDEWLDSAPGHPLVLDTEFERVNTFYPIPGLVQLGLDDRFCLVDPVVAEQSARFREVIADPVSYTHLRAHETDSYLVCRLLLEK